MPGVHVLETLEIINYCVKSVSRTTKTPLKRAYAVPYKYKKMIVCVSFQ